MKTWILAATFSLLTSLSASATTFVCELTTSADTSMVVDLPSTQPGSEATLQFVGQNAVHATLSRSFNPDYITLEISPRQSLSGKAYLERAMTVYGSGELILGTDKFACHQF